MPRLKHTYVKDHPYAVTTVTLNREPIFKEPKAADIVLESVLFGRRQHWYYLLSFVIMPDHVHLVIIPRKKNISECVKSIKGFSARKINELLGIKGSLWQDGFYDYILDTENKTLSRIKYLEDNPVRKGIVPIAEDYKYN